MRNFTLKPAYNSEWPSPRGAGEVTFIAAALKTLMMDGIAKACQGLTTLEEVKRLTGEV
jgi:type II secretory ATPase GspE/PulE/Tfp pilus assembly ATPase PilB-like protein